MKRKRTLAELQELVNQALERGQELKELRLLGSISLQRAAEWARVSTTTIFRFENGMESISDERYQALRTFFIGQINQRQARAAEIIGNMPASEKGK